MQPNLDEVKRIIAAALAEDVGQGDITSRLLLPEDKQADLAFVSREALVMCGGFVVAEVFRMVNPSIACHVAVQDGVMCGKGVVLITVSGPARDILTAERTALNLLQRMSAVATLTAQYVKATAGTKAVILDTRKTMPGLRILDKYAVTAGGGKNHRMRLDDGILIKDNHIAVSGGVAQAVSAAKAGNTGLRVEVECDTLQQVQEAVTAGADIILLDNMDIGTMKQAVAQVNGRAVLEASGNMTLERVRAVAETGVDFISVGRITHSVPNVDIGLDVRIR